MITCPLKKYFSIIEVCLFFTPPVCQKGTILANYIQRAFQSMKMGTLGFVTTTDEGIFNLLTAGFGGGGGGSGAPMSISKT